MSTVTTERHRFYRQSMSIAVPIMIQNGITNFVSMLDNIMVGRIGTDAMSGVAVVNQLVMVWYLMIFGELSGISIFTTQYFGKKDEDGIRCTMRLMVRMAAFLLAVGLAVFFLFDTSLISLYLYQDSGIGDAAVTLMHAERYLHVMMIGFLPLAVTQVYSMTLKATGETLVPMKASVTAVMINLIGNYILIYGKFGAPQLGVQGAAWATVLSRFAEAFLIILWTHKNSEKNSFIRGVYITLHVPSGLRRKCISKALPLLINETLWSAGQAALAESYAFRGLSVVAAVNISMTVTNVFNVAFLAMGQAIGIILGQMLGKGDTEHIQHSARRLRLFSVVLCVATSVLMLLVSGIFPKIYNTSGEIRALASSMIRVTALLLPLDAYANAAYFTLRSGGRTLITFLFDSCFSWVCMVPAAFLMTRMTDLSILPIYTAVLSLSLVKCLIGYTMIRRGVWIQDITEYTTERQ